MWNDFGKKIDGNKWLGTSNSGVEITGYEKPKATAYPVYREKNNEIKILPALVWK